MKKIQKLALSLLAITGISTWNTAAATTFTLEVDSGLATASSALDVGNSEGDTIYKKGAGAIALSGVNTMYSLEIQQGSAQIANPSSMPSNNIAYTTNSGNICEINVAGAAVPSVSMSSPGYLLADHNTTLGGMSGAAALSIAGGFYQGTAGAVAISGDLSSSVTPAVVAAASSALVNPATGIAGNTPAGLLQVGGAGNKMSGGALTVNGVLELTSGIEAKAVPGPTTIAGNGMLLVGAGITVPPAEVVAPGGSPASVSDIFSNAVANTSANTSGLKFNSGATLKLGNGANFGRNITVGSFDK